jgi:2-methylisocitrate lyase-like PEP mutase family enzyme
MAVTLRLDDVIPEESSVARRESFLTLHQGDRPLVMVNPWDIGSARLLESLGFAALATTSSGFAATLGRLDGHVTRDESLTYAGAVADAVGVPVTADLENGFAHAPEGVADTIRRAADDTTLAGGSVEDYAGRVKDEIYELPLACERVTAAAEAAHASGRQFVLTARAENYLHGRTDLADTIKRLQAYQSAGADVLMAPGINALDDIASVVREVDRPFNVIAGAGPTVAELASVGVRRISVGGSFAYVALAAVVDAATELRDAGTYGYAARVASGRAAARNAFT